MTKLSGWCSGPPGARPQCGRCRGECECPQCADRSESDESGKMGTSPNSAANTGPGSRPAPTIESECQP